MEQENYFNNDFSGNSCISIDTLVDHVSMQSTEIDIRNNDITELNLNKIPQHITKINASKNKITTLISDGRDWDVIHLTDNHISIETIENFRVNKLFMRDSLHSTVDTLIFKNCVIGKLVLDDNCVKNLLFENTIIENLSVNDCCIKEIISLPIGLNILSLASNDIEYIHVEFEDSIEILILEKNKLKTAIFKLPLKLKKMDLSNNRIEYVKLKLPENFVNLDLSCNKIKNVDDDVILNNKIKFVDFSANQIESVDQKLYEGLEYVNFDDNEFNKDMASDSDSDIHIRTILNGSDESDNNSTICYMPDYDIYDGHDMGFNENDNDENEQLDEYVDINLSETNNLRSRNEVEEKEMHLMELFSNDSEHANRIRRIHNGNRFPIGVNNNSHDFSDFYKRQMEKATVKKINNDKVKVNLRWNN